MLYACTIPDGAVLFGREEWLFATLIAKPPSPPTLCHREQSESVALLVKIMSENQRSVYGKISKKVELIGKQYTSYF